MSYVSSGAAPSSSDVAERSQNASCSLAKAQGVRFDSFVEVRAVPFEDRAGFVPVHPSASPAKPVQRGIKGEGVELIAEFFIGFCSRVAERRRLAAQRRARQEEEREMLKGIGGRIKEIEKPGVFRAAIQMLEVSAQDLCLMMKSDCDEIFSSILGSRSDPAIGQDNFGSQCKE